MSENISYSHEENNTEYGFISSNIINKIGPHADSPQIKNKFPDIFDSYFKFCVVRNPYDRIVSRYFWDLKVNEIEKKISFKEYLENEDTKGLINKINDDWYDRCTIYNNPICDYYIKFNQLEEGIKEVFDKLNINDKIDTSVIINENNINGREKYQLFYNDYTKEIVYRNCIQEIKYFNWKF